MLEQIEDRGAAHALANFEFAGLDRIMRTEYARHRVIGFRTAGDRAFLRELAGDRPDGRAFLDDDGVRTGLWTRTPPQDIDCDQRRQDQQPRGRNQSPHTAFMISEALVPPKPKLLLSTARTRRFFAL